MDMVCRSKLCCAVLLQEMLDVAAAQHKAAADAAADELTAAFDEAATLRIKVCGLVFPIADTALGESVCLFVRIQS
jgi:hypothetical protein